VVEGEAMSKDEPDYDTFEDYIIHYLKVIATEMTKIRKEINYANTKEKK
jgi:hypothetical protein